MSKKEDSKHNLPNVVAKLMGLESLPRRKPNLAMERSHKKHDPQHMYGLHSCSPFNKEMSMFHHPGTEQIAYKDIYEIWQQKSKRITNHVRDKKTPERGTRTRLSEDDVDGKKMALIHQKFMEAKRLSVDERLRGSKQFEDALEVLSSNGDLLIRLLDELHCAPPAETNHITLFKPLKMVDDDNAGKRDKSDGQIKKPASVDQAAICENKNSAYSSSVSKKVDEFLVQSTKIVVLKRSSGGIPELKAVVSPTTSSPRNLQSGNFYGGAETLYSSVFSNGHRGYESSFKKPYHECTAGNSSYLEAMSTLSRHSCGGSAYSPESPVIKEAKKRLSERWAMMASNNKGLEEQRHLKRCSTLGEMLSLSHIKKSVTSEVDGISCSHSLNGKLGMFGSPKNLPMSNHVTASSTVCETGLRVEGCDQDADKAQDSEVLTKSKSMRSSFKGKVMNLLFSRNKKPTKEKSSSLSQSAVTETSVSSVNSSALLRDYVFQSFNSFEECSLPALCESSGKTSSDSLSNGQQQGIITLKPGLTVSKTMLPDIASENQDQPSPVSVLEPSFEDDNAAHESLDCMKGGHRGSQVPLKTNLIDKSPPIESIARTLSWNDSCSEVASPLYPFKPLMVSSLDTKVEEHEWLPYVEKLLSAAGLDEQVHFDTFYTRLHLHSLESPLDPSLRDKCTKNLNGKEPQPLNEAKRRKIRSSQKLVFDCVNAALLEITSHYGSEKYFKRRMHSGAHIVQEGASPYLMDHIVAQMKELIAMRCILGDCGDSNSLVVENVVRKEVVGIEWDEVMGLVIDILEREIEVELIEELVENAVADFIGRA